MMKSAALVIVSLVAMTTASPADMNLATEPVYQTEQEIPVIDLASLVDVALEMQYNLDILFQLLEETAQNISAPKPHVIHKRQTRVSGSVQNGQGGPRANVDVSHTRGGTTWTGNINTGRGGTGWSVGGSHQTSGGWNFGGSAGRQPGGGSSGRLDFGRTWNNGNTRLGGFFGRSGGSNSGGFRFTHRFRK